jgi:hypothetical protein
MNTRLTKKPGFWQVDIKRTRPMPFPGRFPTRWHLAFYGQDGKTLVWKYQGKPDPQLFSKVYKIGSKQRGWMFLAEYDRGGAFRHTWQGCPRGSWSVGNINSMLSHFYYPWYPGGMEQVGNDFFYSWSHPCFPKQVMFGGKKFSVYSGIKKMNVMDNEEYVQRLRDYRAWLKKSNPWK